MLLTRYILREVLATSITALLLLAAVFAAWSAAGLLADAVNGRFTGVVALQLLALRTLIAGEVLVPTALFVGTVWTYTRLDRDAELPVIYAAGIPPRRLLRAALVVGVLGATLVAVLALFLRPWAYQVSYGLEEALVPEELSRLETGRFHQWGDDLTLRAASADPQADRLRGVFAERILGERRVQVVRSAWLSVVATAASSNAGDVRRLEFGNGRAWTLHDGRPELRSYRFSSLSFTAALPGSDGVRNRRRAMPTAELWNATGAREQAEREWRLLLGPLTLGMVLLGAVLGRGQPRSAVYPRLLAAAGAFVLLFVAASAARSGVENGDLPGMLWVPLLPLGLLALVRWRQART